MNIENIQIAAIYFSPTKQSGEPYYDVQRRSNYNRVTIYEAGKQRDGRKIYGKEFGTSNLMRSWKKGDTVMLEVTQSKDGKWWNFEVYNPLAAMHIAQLAAIPIGQYPAPNEGLALLKDILKYVKEIHGMLLEPEPNDDGPDETDLGTGAIGGSTIKPSDLPF